MYQTHESGIHQLGGPLLAKIIQFSENFGVDRGRVAGFTNIIIQIVKLGSASFKWNNKLVLSPCGQKNV